MRPHRTLTIAEKVTDWRALKILRIGIGTVAGGDELAAAHAARPKTRGECVNGTRPCPWVSCEHHLYLDVTESGSLKLNFPDIDPHEMGETCALDVAERGPLDFSRIGKLINITHERVRQVENKALASMRHAAQAHGIEAEDLGGLGGPGEPSEPDHLGVGNLREHFRAMRDKGPVPWER